ncbi:PREDICTED: glutathione S-transferase T3-like [Brassica oleracea var. oleracea]|uniref:glutathione S-transferase T3-like n=1 Tax=Brassica oleracea var. oleracea TaxID=109376 RepID=UPI0006A6CB75|nr:PREDICTED: glutathione S-transferase T3-like [Brassica oleracea var. oleracea]
MKVEEDEEEEEEEARSDCRYEHLLSFIVVRVSLLLIHYGINTNVRNGFTIIKAFVFYFRKQQPPNTSFSFLNCEPSIEVTSSDAKWAEYDIEDEHTVSDHKERRKWSPTEDIVLISAWLNTSKDPVVGNEQKAIAFWKQIAGYFASCPKVAARKQKSSGQSEDGVLKMAHEIFFNDFKVKFTLEHAWLKLRHDQKWCGASETKDKVSSKRRKLNDQSQQSASSVPGCDGEDEASARPIGVKAAKGKGKSKAKTSDEAVDGKIIDKFYMNPRTENMESYEKLCHERASKYMCKNNRDQVIDNATGMHMRPTPGTITPTGFLEKKKVANKTSEMKRTRRGRREMEEVMFNLFEGHSNWTLRLLIQETDQPEQFLKDLLRDLCIYNNKGSNQGTYELKPDYKKATHE